MRDVLAATCLLLAWAAPSAAQNTTETEILFTGKLMGYLRLPDEQSGIDVINGCPDDLHGGSAEAIKFFEQDEYKKRAKGLLLGMGDNFAPEMFSRVFRPIPELPHDEKRDVRKRLYGKDQYTWFWDPANPRDVSRGRWRFVGTAGEAHPMHDIVRQGLGSIPTDNVACFLAAAGYDAVVPGKHDFYFGPERLRYLARFLATPRGSAPRVQMLASNLVIRTTFASPGAKTVDDADRGLDYATTDPEKEFEPAGFKDGGFVLPWIQKLSFKYAKTARPGDPLAVVPVLYATVPGDPARRTTFRVLKGDWTNKDVMGKTESYADLVVPDGALRPGTSYAVCLRRGIATADDATPARDYCVRFTVDHPFFRYPWDPSPDYVDPDPYLWKCLGGPEGALPAAETGLRRCAPGQTEVAVFGVVEPQLKEHIGQLNYGWLNDSDRKRYKTEIEVLDPWDALQQVGQLFDREHPRYQGLKILLAQMSFPRAQQLASKLRGEFHVVIAEPQVEHATANIAVEVKGTDLRPLVVVPRPFYDPFEDKPYFSLRTLRVTRQPVSNEIKWTYRLTGDRVEAPRPGSEVERQPWVQEALYNGWNKVLPNHRLKPNVVDPRAFRTAFQEYTLRVMKETAGADVALLQKRDFFFGAHLTRKEVQERNISQAIDRVLWKGDLLVKRALPGKALKDALARSKDFDARDASLLSLEVERGRGLLTLGIVHDPKQGHYLVNGDPLDDGRLYTVATSDYAGLGDTGYPELAAGAAGGPLLPRDFEYLCPLHLIVELATSETDGDYRDATCNKALLANDYLDHLDGAPRDLRLDTYGARLRRWVSRRRVPADPWATMRPMERKTQLGPTWFMSLKKGALGYNFIDNNVTEAEREDQFKGSNLGQVQAAESSYITYSSAGSAGISWRNSEVFISGELAHTRTSTARRSAADLVNYADNRFVAELGAFYRLRERRWPRIGPQLSIRLETQWRPPLENLSLADGATLSFERPRTWNTQLPRAGLRIQGRESRIQFGVEHTRVERIEGLEFEDPETRRRVTCVLDASRAIYNPNCVRDNSALSASPRIATTSRVRALRSKVSKLGLYAVATIVVPPAAPISYVAEHDFEWLAPDRQRDLPSMTHWRWLMTHGIRFKILDNLAVTPKVDLFLYENQSGPDPSAQHFFRQVKSSVELSYSFDWHQGNPGKSAVGYKKPEK